MTDAAGVLNPIEVRVLGSLVEKELTTPDYYPLTLNALTNACNQSSNRDPVLALDERTVVRALDGLRDRRLAYLFDGAQSRVPKYGHKIGEVFELTGPEIAVLCVLMLRGPQTVGEIRGRTGRMHEFATLPEAEAVLEALGARSPRPLVMKLPRQPGLKEQRYAHLLGGEPAAGAPTAAPPPEAATLAVRAENERLTRLEEETAALRREIEALKAEFAQFRKQFD
jgi:uncharacterized protein YceH (UPF0502 family)